MNAVVPTPDASDALTALPVGLRAELLKTYNEMVHHFRAGRWEPSELNGGKFCEVVYSVLRGHADGSYPDRASKPKDMVTACRQLEQAQGQPRTIRIQIPRMLIALYEIRNNRSVGHVGGDVDPNHMDALCALSMARWTLAELVRIFHEIDVDEAAAVVEALTERESPAVWEVGGRRRVLHDKLSARDSMLLLLYSTPLSVTDVQLIEWLEYANPSRFRKVILTEAHKARLIEYDRVTGTVLLSPRGVRYVETDIPRYLD